MRRLLVQGLAATVACAILVGLGVWQLDRLSWKEALIARVDARLTAAPTAAPGPERWAALDLADAEYEPVTVSGHFLNDREAHVVMTLTEPKGKVGGVGFLVMTPLVTPGGWTVYVNRGFVPAARRDPATRTAGETQSETKVTGLLRAPSARSWFMPSDNVGGNEWFSRDPERWAAAYGAGSDKIAPFIIDANFDPTLPGGLPQGGETIVQFPNNHLQYALTWFGLAAVLAGVFGAYAWRNLRQA